MVPAIGSLLALLLGRSGRKMPDLIALFSALVLLSTAIAAIIIKPLNNLLVYKMGGWAPPLGINLVMDGLTQLLLIVINLAALIAIIYSFSYIDKYTARSRYYALFMFMLAGMNGAVLAGDLFSLFIFLELASISSAVLVAFGTEAEEMEAALKYLVIGTIASLLILLGIALIYNLAGTLNLADLSIAFQQIDKPIKLFLTVLLLIGLFTKAAAVPFHSWLPDAHPAAPAPVSAMLSGVLIKALGIYALARITFNILGFTADLSTAFLLIGALSIITGSFLAIGQNDLKRMLACSTIAQAGYILLGLGLATPLGIMGALFHLFNHSLIKPLLFLAAGSVEYATGSRLFKDLGGLAKKMPLTSASSLIGSLAISGIPPFNGFWSKFFIILACIQAGRLGYALIAVVGGILTLAYCMRSQKRVFSGETASGLDKIKEIPWPMGMSMLLLALLVIVIGIGFPFFVNILINPAVISLLNGIGYGKMVLGGF